MGSDRNAVGCFEKPIDLGERAALLASYGQQPRLPISPLVCKVERWHWGVRHCFARGPSGAPTGARAGGGPASGGGAALTPGYGQEEDLWRSADAGFNLHLTKPVDFAELERLLEAGPVVGQA